MILAKDGIRAEIQSFVHGYRERRNTETRWRTPLVGFAAADDPLFERLKSAVSPTHAMPRDLLVEARTVISLFIPFEKQIAWGNIEGRQASRAWVKAYAETNELISAVCQHVTAILQESAHAALPTPPTHNFDHERLVSDWSQRHVAFIAGLGDFGHNNMLITDSGCCGRVGSVVTSLRLEPDRRPELTKCLNRFDASCLRCVKRCVNDALHKDRFDRRKCYEMCLENERSFEKEESDVCGKCLVGLPCSFTDPVKARRNRELL
jgi:epoxyqueuosine reductase QueG